jgi:hypothetical protein
MSKCVICGKWFVCSDKRAPHGTGQAHVHHFTNFQPSASNENPIRDSPWNCGFCHERNSENSQQCGGCGVDKNISLDQVNVSFERQRWNCQVCTFEGIHWDSTHCEICSQPKGAPPLHQPHGIPSLEMRGNDIVPCDAKDDSKYAEHDERTCIICFVKPRSHLFVPCFHLVSCTDCIQNFCCGNPCPVCRTQITEMKQVYFA